MSGIWLISYLSLWIIVIVLFLVVLTLARQVGLLHGRLRPTGALMANAGPEVGEQAPEINATDLHGQEVSLGSNRGKKTLLVFVSATCRSCDDLVPAVRSIWKSERAALDLLLVGLSGDEIANREFIARHKLGNIPYVLSRSLGLAYRVTSPPYSVLIDEQGVVRAKGVVNHIEHLESLLNAAELGHSSVESFFQAQYDNQSTIATDTT